MAVEIIDRILAVLAGLVIGIVILGGLAGILLFACALYETVRHERKKRRIFKKGREVKQRVRHKVRGNAPAPLTSDEDEN